MAMSVPRAGQKPFGDRTAAVSAQNSVAVFLSEADAARALFKTHASTGAARVVSGDGDGMEWNGPVLPHGEVQFAQHASPCLLSVSL